MRIKGNKQLFDKLRMITSDITTLNTIVQNDMEISEKEIEEWKKLVATNIQELWKWHKKVEKWISE